MLLLNATHPYLRILLPSGEYAVFNGGKLEVDKDTPGYETIMEVAKNDPHIVIVESAVVCPWCGEPFTGKSPKMRLGSHVKQMHFDKWVSQQQIDQTEAINVEVKRREGYVCDACPNPALAVFGNETELAIHTQAIHANAPELTESGEDVKKGGDDRRPGEREPLTAPPATVTKGPAPAATVPHG